jgi:hypothetical protein
MAEGVPHSFSRSLKEMLVMKRKTTLTIATALLALAVLARVAMSAQDKYSLKVPGGLAFSEFRGYEDWQVAGVSHPQEPQTLNVIVANPTMIAAFRAGIPGSGKPFPDGSRMAKLTYGSRQQPGAPFSSKVPGELLGVGFMVRDSKRFPDSAGWGWAQFKYDAASQTFAPFTMTDTPPQANDARCGFACHTAAKGKDYVFTEYAKR